MLLRTTLVLCISNGNEDLTSFGLTTPNTTLPKERKFFSVTKQIDKADTTVNQSTHKKYAQSKRNTSNRFKSPFVNKGDLHYL